MSNRQIFIWPARFTLVWQAKLLAYAGMFLHRRQVLAASGGLLASACVAPTAAIQAASVGRVPHAPLRISENRVTRITVCLRPFRPAGPRLEAEGFGDKTVIHNYGHGGSGWSLSWACADDAVALARETGATEFAIIGAGVIGLTSAVRLAETGAKVTLYAKEFPSETRSARATGVWSPSSRIALHSAAPEGFAETWERWARKSWSAHQGYIGSVGRPVEFQPFYPLRAETPPERVPETHDFMHLHRRINDIMPSSNALPEHRFPVASARESLSMAFNVAAYSDRLVRDFLAMGGRMIRRDFADRSTALSLPQPVILNCTGYGAKALWGADDLVPVRGQINWLPTQPEARYGLFYNDVYVLSRGDGVVVQYVGPNDDFGYGIGDETPDLEEMKQAIGTIAPLFAS